MSRAPNSLPCFLFSLVAVTALHAQQPPAQPDILTLHTGTHLVLLDVTVTDKKGHTVPGLTKGDFQLYEDDQLQTIKYFEEHSPVDPAEAARNKEALAASLPPNTFTSSEAFSGSATILLMNELTPLPDHDLVPLHRRMIEAVLRAPPETQFILYLLDSELHLIQPLTTDRTLVLEAIEQLWVKQHFPPNTIPAPSLVVHRREILTATAQQLGRTLESVPGRKTLLTFTGGLRCSLSSDSHCESWGDELETYLCRVEDILEQGRISIYREYPDGQILYGFGGCNASRATLQDVFDAGSHYYTHYYTPTNEDWNGAYRKFRVTVADGSLNLSYRPGYYGTPENASAHYNANAQRSTTLSPALTAIAATDVPTGSVGSGSSSAAETTKPRNAAPNPVPVAFTVEVTPADAPGTGPQVKPPSPGSRESEKLRLQGYRDYTLRFSMPASEFKVAQDSGLSSTAYMARLEIVAVSYVAGHPADESSSQVSVNFAGPDDPRIAKSAITAALTVQVPEHGGRLLHVTVRDLATNQFGRLDIPVEKISVR